jgi:hypothetical protein
MSQLDRILKIFNRELRIIYEYFSSKFNHQERIITNLLELKF